MENTEELYTHKTVPTKVLWKSIEKLLKPACFGYMYPVVHEWALPSKNIITKIVEIVELIPHQKLISIGAGFGLWERLIYEEFRDKEDHLVIALEIKENFLDKSPENTYYPLTKGDIEHNILEEIDPNNNSVLLVYWPHRKRMMKSLHKCNSNYIVYVGLEKKMIDDNEDTTAELEYRSFKLLYTLEIEHWQESRTIVNFYQRRI